MTLLHLAGSDVQVGLPLPWNVRNGFGMLLLARGFVIEDDEQLRLLLERGACVDAEEAAGCLPASAQEPATAPGRALGLFDEWAAVCKRLEGLLRSGGQAAGFGTDIAALAIRIAELVDCDEDVAIYSLVRQENVQFFNYGFAHSVHTAIACVLMVGRIGWPAEKRQSLACAALTMNLSMVYMQGAIATQNGPPTGAQKAAIRAHPIVSAKLLRAAGVIDPDWLTAVEQHHERPDGSGYPTGRTDGAQIALALRHADTLTAKISPRASRPGLTMQQAAGELFQEDSGGALSSSLIKALGIYPPGDFVKLRSGEYAVVMRRSDNARTPVVGSVTDKSGTPRSQTIRRDTADPAFAVVSTASDKQLVALMRRIPPQRLYGMSI